ncbi:MAG: hypothetical protein ABI851_04250 [Saprospiraceae bacterium]
MDIIDYEDILKKIGEERDFSKLSEEELYIYDVAKAVRNVAAKNEMNVIAQSISSLRSSEAIVPIETSQGKLVSLFNSWKLWHLAAAGIALVIGSYWIVKSFSNSSNSIFKNNFKQETQYILTAKENLLQYGMIDTLAESRDSLLKGLELYENKNHNEAIEMLSSYLLAYPNSSIARFYLALSQMSVNQFEMAKQNFILLYDLPDLEFAEEVRWHYALCLLKTEKNKVKIKQVLRQLADSKGKYEQKAKETLEKL